MQCNIRGWASHSADLVATIRLTKNPPIMVCVNETFLNKAVEDVSLEGYALLGRRDRRDQDGGGVLVFGLPEHEERITLVKTSDEAERMWFVIHSDQGPIAVCAWYRPPASGEVDSISSFHREWDEITKSCTGTIAIGDFNVHSKRWLKWSGGESSEGKALERVCQEVGAKQIVKEPTRDVNLLDLVLTDIDGVKAVVSPGISDHEIVTASLRLSVPKSEVIERQVWQYREADWDRLIDILDLTDWSFAETLDTSSAAERMTELILDAMLACIPKRTLQERKSTHPWLTELCVAAVRNKQAARGTDREREAAEECSRIMLQERDKYRGRACKQLAKLPPGSKRWWSKSKTLLDKKQGSIGVPALKKLSGEWVLEPAAKAEHLAETFAAKCKMIEPEQGTYSELKPVEVKQLVVPLPDEQLAASKLRALDVSSATGPDHVPARVLKMCASVLAKPLAALTRRIVHTGLWPALWLKHWITPLYKKKAVFDAKNYRGVHLTAQISKVCERMLQVSYVPFLIATVAFGPNQFAYSPGRGSRDAVALMVLTWLTGFEQHLKFAVYCSDVKGAFDKVSCKRLLEKLRAKGVDESVVKVLASWLRDRVAQVVVGGKSSSDQLLRDMVYQGTVLGPGLWNIMYEDARIAIALCLFIEIIYADDLNCFRSFPCAVENAVLKHSISQCQSELHRWGRCNQIEFDPEKESSHVVARHDAEGSNFRILGIDFDCKLLMADAVHETAASVRWKLHTLMRSKRFFSDAEMVLHYKSHILSFIEYRTSGLYHACSTLLREIDVVQERFLRSMGISEYDAFLAFNLAPLRTRRDIAMLGLIHRSVLGLGPDQFRTFFKRDSTCSGARVSTRFRVRRHDRQLTDPRGPRFTEQLRRSALGLIACYNLLPQGVVDSVSVSLFQSQLQAMVRDRAQHCSDWPDLFSPRTAMYQHPLA